MARFECSVIEPLLPTKVRGFGVFWRLCTGASQADIPARYGPHTTCVNRYNRWRRAGHWERILEAVSAACDGDVQMIDRHRSVCSNAPPTAKKRQAVLLLGSLARRSDNQDTCSRRYRGTGSRRMLGRQYVPHCGGGHIRLADRADNSDALRAAMAERCAWAASAPCRTASKP